MNQDYLASYAPLLLHFIFVLVLAAGLIAVSALVGPRKPTREKLTAYECGIGPLGDAREPYSVKFYLVGMLFIVFDVEAVFFFPWAVITRELGMFGFYEMLVFIVLITAGYVYVWKKGALDWSK